MDTRSSGYVKLYNDASEVDVPVKKSEYEDDNQVRMCA